MEKVKRLLKPWLPLFDALVSPLVIIAVMILKAIRTIGIQNLRISRWIFRTTGVFPLIDHYYEPKFVHDFNHSQKNKNRQLQAIDFRAQEQLLFLERLNFSHELSRFPTQRSRKTEFYFNNDAFRSADADIWYQLIRWRKPARIFEIGSGFSSLLAQNAIRQTKNEDSGYHCRHVCIEPFEYPWLDSLGLEVIRQKVEETELSLFQELSKGDILFIDSSHMIRPGGDVLFEYLHILPLLEVGVIVHIHDIFTPNDYPQHWFDEKVTFWNEQYLLEAFLSNNDHWRIVAGINYLHHYHHKALKQKSPHLKKEDEPGSFYIEKVK